MRLVGLSAGMLALAGCGMVRAPVLSQGEPPPAIHEPSTARGDPSIAWDPRLAPITPTEADPLTIAAECLERGDRENAAVHLETYVCRHPEQIMFRAQLAELLVRVGREDAAKAHFERFVADAQTAAGAPCQHLVTAHTRLMEIAQRRDDRFSELFHRGVGLLLLSKEQAKHPDGDPAFVEEMLCKALKTLAEAKELKPGDSRTRIYLAEAHERCGNERAANAERTAARSGLISCQLTAAERRNGIIWDPSGP
jgi:hypothetical protein